MEINFADVEKNLENVSPLPSPDEERHSVYDNVPLIICNKSYHDYQPEVMDSGEFKFAYKIQYVQVSDKVWMIQRV